jgi:hypothetical protein
MPLFSCVVDYTRNAMCACCCGCAVEVAVANACERESCCVAGWVSTSSVQMTGVSGSILAVCGFGSLVTSLLDVFPRVCVTLCVDV